ncbi:ABC transporter substrate-binding protein [Isoptericola cucumis]|uniref:ABC transporter substrate-binding protein n=1 Tax=Isoptericola cucumis TaxID=1776856 RepID=A0ABQ2B768_9MICO|nr:ABC transporter substrate-binding protein [Isoptericola cucumis]GGI09346.1 ABC transporter substrate-binding protein [Isoptericola cucumis]
MRTLPALAASATAAVLLLTGCTTASQDGGGAATAPADESTALPDLSAIEVDPEVEAMVPEGVSEDGTLTVGSNLEYAPVEFVDADGKTPVGLDIDIVTAVAATMGLEADVQNAGFDSIIPAIGSKFEVGFSAFSITPERLDTVNMVSYFTAGSQLAVAKGNPDDVAPDDLCGVTVGVQTGTIQQDELGDMDKECADAGKDAIDVLPYDSQSDVTTNLAGGKLQAMYADSPIIAYAVEQTEGSVETLGDITDAAPYGAVVAKDDTELAKAVQAALQKLMDDGVLAEVADAWGSGEAVLGTAELNPAG